MVAREPMLDKLALATFAPIVHLAPNVCSSPKARHWVVAVCCATTSHGIVLYDSTNQPIDARVNANTIIIRIPTRWLLPLPPQSLGLTKSRAVPQPRVQLPPI